MNGKPKSTLLELKNISYKANSNAILENINLKIYDQEVITIIGPNGAGKTTLIRILLGLVKPTKGQIKKSKPLRIGYMPQKFSIKNTLPLTVNEFLKLTKALQKEWLTEVVSLLRITHILERPIYHISGGELQRVLLARSILSKPQLLILDEPIQGIDMNGQTELYGLLNSIHQKLSCSIIMISHDLHFVMANTNQVICLNKHICCKGHPEQITQHPEFQALFDITQTANLAVYVHDKQHDHSHHHNPRKQ